MSCLFLYLTAVELQFTYYRNCIHCVYVCWGVDACVCVHVFISVNKTGEGAS